MEKQGRGRGKGRGSSRSNLDKGESDFQTELKTLSTLSLNDDDASKTEFEVLKSKFEDDVVASVFSATTAGPTERPGELQATTVTEDPENIGEEIEDKSATITVVPSNLIDAAAEFRADANPSLNRISQHFFCTICGCPAGSNCFSCRKRGHLVCKQCKEELNNLTHCLYVLVPRSNGVICNSKLFPLKSRFGKAIFRITTVSCKYQQNGCRTEGPWKVVMKHQETCPFVKKV